MMRKDVRTPELNAMFGFIGIILWCFLLKESWADFEGKPYNRIVLLLSFAVNLWFFINAIYTVFKSPKEV